MDDILESLGLTSLEIKLFKYLLLNGPNTAGILSRKTGIHRRNAYDALERLIQKGFVSYITENNKKHYQANDPKIVLNKLDDKKNSWENLIPKLKEHRSHWKDSKETLFFRGINGIKHIFLDQINVGEEVLVNATGSDVSSVVKYFFPKYQNLRKEKKIPTRMIFNTGVKAEDNFSNIQRLPLCKLKFVDNFNTGATSTYIYGNNTAIVVWEKEPFAILIRHEEIAKANREQFELIWKNM